MKLTGYGKEIYISLSQQFDEGFVVTMSRQFEEGIVSAVRRQLDQTAFSLSVHQGNTSEIVQQLAAQIIRFHNCLFLNRVKNQATRKWYIHQPIENGWSRNILTLQTESRLQERQGKSMKSVSTWKKLVGRTVQ